MQSRKCKHDAEALENGNNMFLFYFFWFVKWVGVGGYDIRTNERCMNR
jgi:hypothetical protein